MHHFYGGILRIPCEILSGDERLELALRELFARRGYRPFKLTRFEPYDFYLAHKPFLAGERVLAFTDGSGKLKALKPDVTLSVLKNYRGGRQKLRYRENVYRERQGGREFAEIPQAGVEFLGEKGREADREILELAGESLALLAQMTCEGAYRLDVASAAAVRALLDATPVGEDRREALRHLLREKNTHEIGALDLPSPLARMWSELIAASGDAREVLPPLVEAAREVSLEICSALAELAGLADGAAGRFAVDFSIVESLDYYTGVVFKGYLPRLPRPVLSGGRYDGLLLSFGRSEGAVGFAVYLDDVTEILPDETADEHADENV